MGATELTEERPGKEAEGPPDDCTFNVDQDAAVAAKTSRASAAFHEAAKAGDNAALSTLLLAFNSSTDARSSLLIDARDPRTGHTALHVACKAGAPLTVKWLLENGASVLITDKGGYTPLDLARVKPSDESIRDCACRIQEYIQAHPPPIKKVGPLLSSFFEPPPERAWLDWACLHYGPSLLDLKGRDQRSPLHLAVSHKDVALLEELLEMGADPFAKDTEGLSPLDLAMRSGHRESIRVLSRAMQTQLVAFLGLTLLFLLYRHGGDPQQAWTILATLWPLGKTWQLLWTGSGLSAARRGAMGEWLSYWALIVPVFMLEGTLPAGLLGRRTPLERALRDLYMIIKIVGTLYLVYPGSRGARRLYGWLGRRQRGSRSQSERGGGP
ncbi:hypothetical protein NSK_006574 [Nannochloropsis salina CCMP1776]|uniref:Uncharacterized protein n=1 Tax=Nannochloropsis salina CCMP1776 TaxID=1027361 RepID=A0A4D9CSU7_9STRA|nr:hypothetical protein NSK_006574 [Nannochloropsis salina CCMP1776]|eukprot:TFJ81906.1 hypothetical protein NSK_006574 [Nannochloropsis salina CCMP1776]